MKRPKKSPNQVLMFKWGVIYVTELVDCQEPKYGYMQFFEIGVKRENKFRPCFALKNKTHLKRLKKQLNLSEGDFVEAVKRIIFKENPLYNEIIEKMNFN